MGSGVPILFQDECGTSAAPPCTYSTSEQHMNKDQLKGQIKQVKGSVKETTGKIIGDKTMEDKGKVQNTAGKVQQAYGDLKSDIKSDIKKGR